MADIIVSDTHGITLLGGGKARPCELREALTLAPSLVAVDGGAGFAVAEGLEPTAIIGDMDSIPQAVRAHTPPEKLHEIPDQDSTDFDKALRSVDAPLVLGVGFLGRRVDHQLANFNVLARRCDRNCILLGKRDIVFAAPREIALELPPGSRVSLFPMAPTTGRSRGLHWPIDGLDFAPDAGIGTSNRVSDAHAGAVELAFDAAGMLVILPRAALRGATLALRSAERFSPAR